MLPEEHIKTVHTGGPGQRLVALLDGEVEVANLLDPEIPIAEAKGLRKLAQGEFVITFWVSLAGPCRWAAPPQRLRACLPP